MPHVEITLIKGRSVEQKRKTAERITQVVAEELNAKREDTTVAFIEVEKESFAHGGQLVIDRK
ncbi:MAG: tautomerase family protein [Candidatus Koribacter versatilis]|uniref:Tautomerase family protein n=1 Tax=Candidatus Korobacter versatilis TaxID=658062 RepID=A0A932A9X8_9BACT|nr:tautomerase family protein [Candidatus Koribacter versatilis]